MTQFMTHNKNVIYDLSNVSVFFLQLLNYDVKAQSIDTVMRLHSESK
jgi:hypothetical protein